MERKTIKIKVDVDTREIDKAIKKIKYLNKQLNETEKKFEGNVNTMLEGCIDEKELSKVIEQAINETIEEFDKKTDTIL